MFSLDDVRYCASESERQQAGWQGVVRMCEALGLARERAVEDNGAERLPTAEDACRLAALIEPEKNVHYDSFYGWTNFRRTPVTFADGGRSNSADTVPDATINLFDLIEEQMVVFPQDGEKFCKQLLEIHPWVDGNGRTVSIIRNWIMGTLDTPEALPYYFAEEGG